MTALRALVKRNIKLFFKDKGLFFSSLMTPIVLLVLYVTFLGNVYRSSFISALPEGFTVSEKLVNGLVGGQLFSALLAVCCVTVAFCSNMLMVQDKVSGARHDLTITPVKPSVMAIGYYIASAVSTLIVFLITAAIGFIYLAYTGWYLSAGDVFLILADVILLVLFGTGLSSIINAFLSTQGQISAAISVVSAGYGFLCGAYMPISNFSAGLQKCLSFLPGTYGTSLLRNHALRGVFAEMAESGFPEEVISGIKSSVDCNIYFFDSLVSPNTMYCILGGAVITVIAACVLICKLKRT